MENEEVKINEIKNEMKEDYANLVRHKISRLAKQDVVLVFDRKKNVYQSGTIEFTSQDMECMLDAFLGYEGLGPKEHAFFADYLSRKREVKNGNV